jgi:hypothetical protein
MLDDDSDGLVKDLLEEAIDWLLKNYEKKLRTVTRLPTP